MNPQYKELIDYITSHHMQGTDPATLRQQLIDTGWDAATVDGAIQEVKNQNSTPNPAPPIPDSFSTHMQSKPSRFPKQLIAVLALVIVAAAAGAFFFLFRSDSPEDVFAKFMAKNTEATTFTQTYSDNSESDADVRAEAKTDFTDPTNPKSDILLTVSADNSTVTLRVEGRVIGIGDATYINYQAVDVDSDDSIVREQVEALGGAASFLGISNLNEWVEVDNSSNFTFGSGDPLQLQFIGRGVNTVLGEMPIGNFGDKAGEIQALVEGMYTVNFENVTEEEVNGVNAMRFEVDLDETKVEDVNRQIADLLELSELQQSAISDLAFFEDSGDFTIWVNPNTYQPVKVEAGDIMVEYSDFGGSYDISSPL